MREGYIVWNMTEHDEGFEFFGIFRSEKAAYNCYKKVIKQRYGGIPEDDLEMEQMANGDSIRITYFNQAKWRNGYC